jgi:1-acyl-sn-glycerol-3-phosphate acyltransferase
MKYIIAAYLWFISWTFLIIFLVWFLLVSVIFPRDTYMKWVRAYLQMYFKLLFIKVKVTGTENIDPNKTYVFMSNHVSMYDIPLLLGFIPVDFYGIQAANHFKVPIYGHVLKAYGNIPIDRSNARASYRTIQGAVEHLKGGKNIMILPEGTRSRKPIMGPFKKLPFVMVKRAEVNILPFAFSGLWRINNKTSKMIRPGTVHIHFGEAISDEVVRNSTEEELMKLTRERIQSYITEP